MKMNKVFFICLFYIVSTVSSVAGGLEDKVERKLFEINKIVALTDEQLNIIRKAYCEYLITMDSAIYKVDDIDDAMRLKYTANRLFNNVFMSSLNETQRNSYISIMYKPEIEEKTEYRLSLLQENSKYTEIELQKLRKEIFSYLMTEKIVYIRDKYDIAKQKNNIRRLKNIQPSSMKETDILEKMKYQGKLQNGNISW